MRQFKLKRLLLVLLCTLLVAEIALWVGSIRKHRAVVWLTQSRKIELKDLDGVAGVLWASSGTLRSPTGDGRTTGWFTWQYPTHPAQPRHLHQKPSFNEWGFGFHPIRTVGPPQGGWRSHGRLLVIVWAPYWFLVTLTAAWPVVQLVMVLRRRRRRLAGHCSVCGYDLRATPDRCPECGMAAAVTPEGAR